MRQNARLAASKTQSYQGFASFMGVEMSVEESEGVSPLSEALLMRERKRTWFTCINRSRRFLKRKMDRGKKNERSESLFIYILLMFNIYLATPLALERQGFSSFMNNKMSVLR